MKKKTYSPPGLSLAFSPLCSPSQRKIMLINYLVIYFFCPLTWRFFLCCCSVTKSCPALCDPMDCSTPGSSVLHHLLEFAQTQVLELVMPSNHLIVCCPLLILPSVFPSIRVFSSESALLSRWPKYWSFSFSRSFLGYIKV